MPVHLLPRRRGVSLGSLLLVVLVLVAGIEISVASPAQAATSGRVTRVGSQLYLNGQPWRFAGVNEYWLGLDGNVTDSQGPTYPSHAKIDEGFSSARTMGATVVRSTTLGVSVGSPRSIEPALGQFNDAAFDTIDYSVATAAADGIHLMIPLTDMWHYYHGGKHTFTNWRGYTDLPGQTAATSGQQKALEANFYTDPTVISDFHAYIAHVLNHVNPYTGIRLGDDPTIAIWETGNELWDAPASWTSQTATYIKSLAPQALVADGSAATGRHVADAAIDAPDVDIVGGHFYPTDPTWMATDASVAAQHGKAYVVGEFSLSAVDCSDPLGWMKSLAANPNVSGVLTWALMPHMPDGSPESSGDGLGFHLPPATADEAAQVSAFEATASLFGSAAAPAPTPTPSAPANLVSAAVASAASPTTFVGGSSGSGAVTVSSIPTSVSQTGVRVTAGSAGYTWLYPKAFSSGASVVAGRTYTGVVFAHPATGSASTPYAAHLSWYDASGKYLGGADGTSTTPVSGAWTALTVTAVAPANSAWAIPQWQSSAPLASGDAVDVAGFGIAAGTTPPSNTPSPISTRTDFAPLRFRPHRRVRPI